MAEDLDHHRIPLAGGGWSLWRLAVLRGTGFPAETVLRLAARDLAAAADRLLDAEREAAAAETRAVRQINQALDELHRGAGGSDPESTRPLLKAVQAIKRGKLPPPLPDGPAAEALAALARAWEERDARRAEVSRLHEAATAATSEEIGRLAGWDLFREAVAWQNREALGLVLDKLRDLPEGEARSSKRRQREELVASYLQRYSAKNDTIGFFGPVGWAELADDGPAVVERPGPRLLARRTVYFEHWTIAELARKLGEDLSLRPWLPPRLCRGWALLGGALYGPGTGTVPLAPRQAAVLAACDGEKTARAIAAQLVANPSLGLTREEQVFEVLQAFCQRGALTWTVEAPLTLHPERALRRTLERIEPEPLRRQAEAGLDELEAGREKVAAAAGDAQALEAALADLEQTFTRRTGAAPRRHHGKLYAARGLVYEDCVRDAEVRFGPPLVERIARPLTLILDSARWLAGELARRTVEQLATLHSGLAARGPVDSSTFFMQAFALLFARPRATPCFREAEREFQARWSRVLALVGDSGGLVERSSAELAPRAAEAFANPGRAWDLARYFSPDLMIAADGEAAFNDGRFQAVLGEIHTSNTLSWSCFLAQHPDPQTVLQRVAADLGPAPVVMPQIPIERWVQRMNINLVLPHYLRFEMTEQVAIHPLCRPLPAGAATVESTAAGLEVASRDGAVRFPAIELFGVFLTEECTRIVGHLLPAARHRPRVVVDDLVVLRQRWRFPPAELLCVEPSDPLPRFLAVRRWARGHGLPRCSFYKVPAEDKPCFLDLDSPIYVDIFARLVRETRRSAAAGEVLLTEMLPDLTQTWLTDREGNRYTCELRLAAIAGALQSAP